MDAGVLIGWSAEKQMASQILHNQLTCLAQASDEHQQEDKVLKSNYMLVLQTADRLRDYIYDCTECVAGTINFQCQAVLHTSSDSSEFQIWSQAASQHYMGMGMGWDSAHHTDITFTFLWQLSVTW